ncbi:MAG: alpha-L-fucosidase [Verrucomicrobiae bacterium]|nr:alpha-L-fucosidase [Verrucomicrobiae bacterium]NNJ42475.1 hypothetical protein [Akkermansiaceae bacterium]
MTFTATSSALEGDPYEHETPAQRDARMDWWRKAKFGMFIHWGVYAVPSGQFEGKKIGGYGEWILLNAKIPVATYKSYAKEFNPVNYNPQAWVDLAKDAGMRYMVITSKHHDGFALYPSAVSDWDIADASPYGKDLIGPLANAARDGGLKFGLYYSQAQDWTHPGGSKYDKGDGYGWDEVHKGKFDDYIDAIAVPQVKEILTRYQPDVLWWDTPVLMKQHNAKKLAKLLTITPGIIHNNRLGGGYFGDTETPEQFVPPTGFPGRDWETCMTMNGSWGFKKHDDNWKSLDTILTNLVDIASKGGNYLLNIGPDPSGNIPQESIDLLKGVGAWMKVNGESIYESQAGPFKRLSWGRCTSKPDGPHTTLYLHVLDWPANGALLIPGLQNKIESAQLLATGKPLKVGQAPFGPSLQVPQIAPDAHCSVIKLRIAGKPHVIELPVFPDADGVLRLTPVAAHLHGDQKIVQRRRQPQIHDWTNPKDTVSWDLQATQSGTYHIKMATAAENPGAVIHVTGVTQLECSVPMTENLRTFKTLSLGKVTLNKGQKVTLTLKPVMEAWTPVSVRWVKLIPEG